MFANHAEIHYGNWSEHSTLTPDFQFTFWFLWSRFSWIHVYFNFTSGAAEEVFQWAQIELVIPTPFTNPTNIGYQSQPKSRNNATDDDSDPTPMFTDPSNCRICFLVPSQISKVVNTNSRVWLENEGTKGESTFPKSFLPKFVTTSPAHLQPTNHRNFPTLLLFCARRRPRRAHTQVMSEPDCLWTPPPQQQSRDKSMHRGERRAAKLLKRATRKSEKGLLPRVWDFTGKQTFGYRSPDLPKFCCGLYKKFHLES